MQFKFLVLIVIISFSPIFSSYAFAEEALIIKLPDPKNQILRYNDSLARALALRATTRKYSLTPLDIRDVSALLWAANGVNRSDGRLTYATKHNRKDTNIIMIDEKGIWNYDSATHSIEFVRVATPEITRKLGGDPAPLTFIYIFDSGRGNTIETAYLQVGSMYQNAALYAAIADINNDVRGASSNGLAEDLTLPRNIEILLIQSFGRE